MKKYFLSFIEEAVLNFEYIGGRIEVHDQDSESGYTDEEIRFFTKDRDGFYAFRDKWDFKEVSEEELDFIKKKVKECFEE